MAKGHHIISETKPYDKNAALILLLQRTNIGGEALQLNAIFFLICSIHKETKLRQIEDFIKIFL